MNKLFYFVIAVLVFASCKKDPFVDNTIQVDIEMRYADEEYRDKLPIEAVTVTFNNVTSGQIRKFEGTSGQINIPDLSPGVYTIGATVSFDAEEFKNLTGEEVGGNFSFNAQLSNVQLNEDTQVALELIPGTPGEFVFKQIYYAGSDQKTGALFRDQFIEIHNNTDNVLYADGLYIARLWGNQSANTSSTYYFQPNKQFDWSKSQDMPAGIKANTDYVYLRDLLQIPGDGSSYPVAPGKSIIIAQNALNHKVPYVDEDGEEQPIGNPDLTVDLSKANFEAYFGNVAGVNPLPSDIDNPEVPNMIVYKTDGRDWLLDNPGRDSYVIFRAASIASVETLPQYYPPLTRAIRDSDKKYMQLPAEWIMDAVEVMPTSENSRIAKKLLANYDAGFTYVLSGSYSSEAVHRKVASEANGIVKLQDTNNSTNDFVSQKAAPNIFVR